MLDKIKKFFGYWDFGPNQQKWLDALESCKYNQCFGNFIKKDKDGNPTEACALGVAYLELGGTTENEFALLPSKYINALKLKFQGEIIYLNDQEHLTFPEIADFMKKNRYQIFEGPA